MPERRWRQKAGDWLTFTWKFNFGQSIRNWLFFIHHPSKRFGPTPPRSAVTSPIRPLATLAKRATVSLVPLLTQFACIFKTLMQDEEEFLGYQRHFDVIKRKFMWKTGPSST